MRLAIAAALLSELALAQAGYRVQLHSHPITISAEDYVAGVLGGEASAFRSDESLKAMAVAARTYALRFRGRHQSEGFDFCETTHCQDLRLEAVNERVRRAVEDTEAEVLWHLASPAATFYHRHCGGTTEASNELWDIKAPYLRQVEDTYCIGRGREWSGAIAKEEFRQVVDADTLVVLERTSSGRVRRIRVGQRQLSGDALHHMVGRMLGWNHLLSTFYQVRSSGANLLFQGYGSGHGVGLCQAGAAARGEQGHGYRQILAFYYPGTVLGINAQGFNWSYMGGERVDVFSTREHDDRELAALADRSLAEAERRTGFRYEQRPRIRVYPTVAAYRDATGESGNVAASTVERTIRLQPAVLLRSIGELERTLLHEMLHVVVENKAHPSLPEWFREGCVLYLVGTPAPTRKYQALRKRLSDLVAAHGKTAVMEWLQRGLPAEVADQRGERQPGHHAN